MYNQKVQKYTPYLNGEIYIPFIMNEYGGLGQKAKEILKELGRRESIENNQEYNIVMNKIFYELSLLNKQCIARRIQNRIY